MKSNVEVDDESPINSKMKFQEKIKREKLINRFKKCKEKIFNNLDEEVFRRRFENFKNKEKEKMMKLKENNDLDSSNYDEKFKVPDTLSKINKNDENEKIENHSKLEFSSSFNIYSNNISDRNLESKNDTKEYSNLLQVQNGGDSKLFKNDQNFNVPKLDLNKNIFDHPSKENFSMLKEEKTNNSQTINNTSSSLFQNIVCNKDNSSKTDEIKHLFGNFTSQDKTNSDLPEMKDESNSLFPNFSSNVITSQINKSLFYQQPNEAKIDHKPSEASLIIDNTIISAGDSSKMWSLIDTNEHKNQGETLNPNENPNNNIIEHNQFTNSIFNNLNNNNSANLNRFDSNFECSIVKNNNDNASDKQINVNNNQIFFNNNLNSNNQIDPLIKNNSISGNSSNILFNMANQQNSYNSILVNPKNTNESVNTNHSVGFNKSSTY